MVEAAGIEPLFPVNTNPMMANDLGFYDLKTYESPRRFDSPGVLPSLGDILETIWNSSQARITARMVDSAMVVARASARGSSL